MDAFLRALLACIALDAKSPYVMSKLKPLIAILSLAFLVIPAVASADKYEETINIFKKAGESGDFFRTAYGYAVFPSIGEGAIGVGGAHGDGRVYQQGKHVGDASMNQVSVGFQLGGKSFSQIIFFQDERAFNEFTRGNFEFGAEASAVAVTASAGAGASTTGSSTGTSAGKHDAKTAGSYSKGMATFTVAKGGLMYQANIGGQKFKYKPR